MIRNSLNIKYLGVVCMVLSTLFSCGSAQTDQAAAKVQAKDSVRTVARLSAPPVQQQPIPVIWNREFSYEDPGPKVGQWETGNTYYLDPRRNELNIAGYSMGCSRAKIRFEPKFTAHRMEVIFQEYLDKTDIDGQGFPAFGVGDTLLTLIWGKLGYSTIWRELSPLYGEPESPCPCFK